MLNEQNLKLEVLKLAAEEKGSVDETITTAKKFSAFVFGGSTTANVNEDSDNETSDESAAKSEEAPAKKRAPRKTKEVAPATDENGKANITAAEALEFAKVKMAEGHDRGTIKAKIVELGSDSISGLTQENLNIFYDYLNELVLEESL